MGMGTESREGDKSRIDEVDVLSRLAIRCVYNNQSCNTGKRFGGIGQWSIVLDQLLLFFGNSIAFANCQMVEYSKVRRTYKMSTKLQSLPINCLIRSGRHHHATITAALPNMHTPVNMIMFLYLSIPYSLFFTV
jgi:hypothetical protein